MAINFSVSSAALPVVTPPALSITVPPSNLKVTLVIMRRARVLRYRQTDCLPLRADHAVLHPITLRFARSCRPLTWILMPRQTRRAADRR